VSNHDPYSDRQPRPRLLGRVPGSMSDRPAEFSEKLASSAAALKPVVLFSVSIASSKPALERKS